MIPLCTLLCLIVSSKLRCWARSCWGRGPWFALRIDWLLYGHIGHTQTFRFFRVQRGGFVCSLVGLPRTSTVCSRFKMYPFNLFHVSIHVRSLHSLFFQEPYIQRKNFPARGRDDLHHQCRHTSYGFCSTHYM